MPIDEVPDGSDTAELRQEQPSGWMRLARNETIPKVVDGLLDSRPGREFNKSELARQAGVSRQSVTSHIDELIRLGVVTEVPSTSPQRYRLKRNSPVTGKLRELNSAVNAVLTDQEWSGEDLPHRFGMFGERGESLDEEVDELTSQLLRDG